MPRRKGNLLTIDDSTPRDILYPKGCSQGLDLSLRASFEDADGYAYGEEASPFPRELLIPESEWQARIQEREERGRMLRPFLLRQGVKVLMQARTNYCWANCVVFGVMAKRAAQGQKHVPLSPASVAGPINGYANTGGWPKEALAYIRRHGIVPQSMWAPNAIDRRLKTPAADAAALNHRCLEWWELQPRNLAQLVSCLLLDWNPVPLGLLWWGHAVCAIDPIWRDGEVAIVFANSYDVTWGTEGYGVLQGNKRVPDDANCPRTVLAA
jgi:hypothetical protein